MTYKNIIHGLALCIFSVSVFAQSATSDFDTESYPGKPGNGWATPWTIATRSGTSLSKQVQSEKPLDGSSRYLENTLTVKPAPGAPVKGGGSSREIDTATIDLSQDYEVSFDFRGQEPAEELGPYRIFQSAASKPGTGSQDTWAVYPKDDGNWYVINGNRDGTAGEELLMPYVPGENYHFVVKVYPDNQTYSISAKTDNGGSAELKQLGFRSQEVQGGVYLNFMANSFAAADGPITRTFAIDNITVTASPAP